MPEQIETISGEANGEVQNEPKQESIAVPAKCIPADNLHQEEPPVVKENGNSVERSDEPDVIACTFVPKEKTAEETIVVSEEPQCPLPPKVVGAEPVVGSAEDADETHQPVENLNGQSVADNKSELPVETEPEIVCQLPLRSDIQNVNGDLKVDSEPKEEKIVVSETNQSEVHPIKKGSLLTNLDVPNVKLAYEEVRSDGNDTQWAVFKFEGPQIKCSAKGSDFKQFQSQFSEDERAFGYIRVQTGDEMSKRQKFLLLTWVGPSVSVLKRAKMSTDKSLIKDIVSNFAVELQTENLADLDLDYFVAELNKAGGANYGTGIRES